MTSTATRVSEPATGRTVDLAGVLLQSVCEHHTLPLVGIAHTTSALFGRLRDDPRSRAGFLAPTRSTP